MGVVNKYIKVVVQRDLIISTLIIYKCDNLSIMKICSVATITYDHNQNQKIPLHHNLDIFIYYYHVQYCLDISCFATAIQILVNFHVSCDVVLSCMSPTLPTFQIYYIIYYKSLPNRKVVLFLL